MKLVKNHSTINVTTWRRGGRNRPGMRFSKDPKTLRARKAIRKTPTRLFCKAGLFICCIGNKN